MERTKTDEIARRIADKLLERPLTKGLGVPNAGTLGDLLRDYERAKVNETLEASRSS